MGIILWIIIGGLAGWIASVIMGNREQGVLSDVLLGIVGAVVGGFIMNLLGQQGVTGFNIYSLIVSVVGAVLLIFIARVLRTG